MTKAVATSLQEICVLDSQQKLSFQLSKEEQQEQLQKLNLNIENRSQKLYKPNKTPAKPPRLVTDVQLNFFPAVPFKTWCDCEGAYVKNATHL